MEYNFLSYIVLYDQIPRHIFRNQDGNHIILYFLNKAIDIINTYKNQANNLNEIEWTFFMLPLRHTNTKDNILYVLNEAWNYKSLPKEFIIATYKKANFKDCPLINGIDTLSDLHSAVIIKVVVAKFNGIFYYSKII